MSAWLRYWLVSLLFYGHQVVLAQEFTMSDGNIAACSGSFFDSGGQSGNYAAEESLLTTICSDNSGGTHIRMFISSLYLGSGDTLFFYDGSDTTAPQIGYLAPSFNGQSYIIQSSAANPGGCMTIHFKSDLLEDSLGWAASFQCIQRCQNIQSAIGSSEPPIQALDGGYLNSCPGNLIELSGQGIYPQNDLLYRQSDETSTFRWEMGDGTIYYGKDIEHRYREPGGYIVQLTVTDEKGCTNTNILQQRVRIADDPVVAFDPTQAEVCAGDQLTTAMASITPTSGGFAIRGYRSDSLVLPDGDGTSYETAIEFSQFTPGQALSSAEDILGVCVNMEHSWLRDLEIKLSCPSGKSIVLHNFAGEEGSGIFLGQPVDFDGVDPTPGKGYDYCWTPNATRGTWLEYIENNLYNEDTLPEGDYRPYESFDNLIGCPLNGKWTIEIRDDWSWDNGFIFFWGINFASSLFPISDDFTPAIADYYWTSDITPVNQTNASITHIPQVAGPISNTFHVTDEYGCTWDTTFQLLALPENHPDCINCEDLTSVPADTTVCAGSTVQLQAGPTNSILEDESTFMALPDYAFNSNNHPLNNPYIHTLAVSAIVPATLEDPLTQISSVCINLEAPVAEAIQLYLQAPNGRIIALAVGAGGSSSNFENICFSPGAMRSLSTSELPLSGTYAAQGNWTNLRGTPMNGDWRLLMADDRTTTTLNRLKSWSITFTNRNKVTYFWTPATGLSCTDCPNPVVSPTTSRTYTVMSKDSYGCIDTDTIRVQVVTSVTPLVLDSVNVVTPTCFGRNDGAATVFVSGGNGTLSYLWSDSLGQFSPKAVFLEAGTYGVTVKDTLGCKLDASIRVTQPDTLTVGFETDEILCKGDSSGTALAIPIGGTQPYQFLWSNQQATPSAQTLKAGSYAVSITDARGCKAQGAVSITEPAEALQVLVEQSDSGCFGQRQNQATALPSGGTGTTYDYRWSDGQTQQVALGLDSLLYRVTVTDLNGCTSSSGIQIRDLQPIDFNIIKNEPSCVGYTDGGMGVNIITGGAGKEISDYSINWSTGGSGNFIENLAPDQTYRVTVTDSKGCFAAKERYLDNPPALDIGFDIRPVSCFGEASGAVSVRGLISNPAQYNITWDAATGNQKGIRAVNLAAGTYAVTIVEPGGCVNTAAVTLGQPDLLRGSVAVTNNRCFGDLTGAAAVTVSGGVPDYRYNWSTGASGAQIAQLRAGSYPVTISDKNGCTLELPVVIEQPEPVAASIAVTEPVCFDSRNGRAAITLAGGTGPFLFSTDNRNFSPNALIPGLAGGNYTLYIKDFNNCTFQEPFSVPVPPEFTVEARISEPQIYQGDSVLLQVLPRNSRGDILYTWSNADPSILSCTVCPDPVARPVLSTTFRVDAIDGKGCEATDRINVNVARPREIAVPTGFSPNGDGVNDILRVHGRKGARVKVFRVFDRWGELLYETGDFEVNDPLRGWDGTFRGELLNSGVYVWYLVAGYPDGSEESFQGQTTLIR